MGNKIRVLVILLITFFLFTSYQSKQEYPVNKRGEPTKYGIQYYITKNQDKIISEFQEFVKDTLYDDVYITVDNLSNYMEDADALGLCISSFSSSEIIITNEEKYLAYEVSLLKKSPNKKIIAANNFVKGTLIHELGHLYFNQVIREMSIVDTVTFSTPVRSEYTSKFFIVPKNTFGAKFIEEGLAEYPLVKMKEEIIDENIYIPTSINEIMDKENKYNVFYRYSCYYLTPLIDHFGVKKAIKILVSNPPPTYDEILDSKRFFARLIIN
jgi:hypothetical protein